MILRRLLIVATPYVEDMFKFLTHTCSNVSHTHLYVSHTHIFTSLTQMYSASECVCERERHVMSHVSHGKSHVFSHVLRMAYLLQHRHVYCNTEMSIATQKCLLQHRHVYCNTDMFTATQTCLLQHRHVSMYWVTSNALFAASHTTWATPLMDRVMSYKWMSHGSQMDESCLTDGWVMSQKWMSRVSEMDESCLTNGSGNESWHNACTPLWVMSLT